MTGSASAACSALVLAGGRSRRMGRPKAWIALGGVPLLAHVSARVAPLVHEVIVVAAAGQELPPVAARVLRDREPDAGPLAAVALGLGAIATPWAFALACDGPFVQAAVLHALAAAAEDGVEAVIPVWQDTPQPLVALYHRSLATPLAALVAAGERRLHVVAARPGVRVLEEAEVAAADPVGDSFRPLNTPADLEAAERRWRATGAGAR